MSPTQSSTIPQLSVLSAYIDRYCFIESDDESYSEVKQQFPHYKTSLTVCSNANLLREGNRIFYKRLSGDAIGQPYFSSTVKKAAAICIEGRFKQLSIVFRPLGINCFVRGRLSDVAQPAATFNHFGGGFQTVCSQVFTISSDLERAALLDAFFVSRLQHFKDRRVNDAVSLCFDTSKAHSLQGIAKLIDVDRKTLYSLFRKHLCCTPSDFRKVVRFREAIDQYKTANGTMKLYEVAYDNLFYDPSHFTRTIVRLTGLGPGKLFKQLSQEVSME